MSIENWKKVQQEGRLNPTSRLDVFINRNAAPGELEVRHFLKDIQLPDFAYQYYSFFVPRLSCGEEYFSKIPESQQKARQFLRQFIDSRMEVGIKVRLPTERVYVIDFAKLLPIYDRMVDRTQGWMNYINSFTSLDHYTKKEGNMPEILVSTSISLEDIVRLF